MRASAFPPPASPGRGAREAGGWPAGIGWLTAAAVLAVVAINVAGIAGIAMAARAMTEEIGRDMQLETAARAESLESDLTAVRADLAFMTGSPVFFGLESALSSRDPREARWRRLEAEGALLLFLRGHPEVLHVKARSEGGALLVEAGRRGGVPVLWAVPAPAAPAGPRSDRGGAAGGADLDAGGPPPPGAPPVEAAVSDPAAITGRFEFTAGIRKVSGAIALEATLDASKLLARGLPVETAGRACALHDADGRLLAGEEIVTAASHAGGARGDARLAQAEVKPGEWSAPAPWTLTCARRRGPAETLFEPFASRYRTTLSLNLAVMSLALLLGAFAIQQARRRQRLEARAVEQARIRDLERQLFHAERLGTVGRLAAGMAHEINNPLEGMVNYLRLAREDLGRGDAPGALRRLDGVGEGLQRVVGIVGQVLAHADPAATPMAALDLNAVLRQTAEFVRSRREFAAIRFQLDLCAAPPMVRGNQALLGQVFLNLILNACEAQPGGGEVRLATQHADGRAVAEVADRGPGVPPDEATRVFEPFYSTKQSTGLGLSICYAIVRQHGGEIAVEPRPGGGARFVMNFPLEPAGAPGGPAMVSRA